MEGATVRLKPDTTDVYDVTTKYAKVQRRHEIHEKEYLVWFVRFAPFPFSFRAFRGVFR